MAFISQATTKLRQSSAATDKVSTDAAPTDANVIDNELSVSLGTGETSTLKLKLTETLDDKKYVTFTAGGKTYQVADSELIENKAVTLTSSYDKTTYTAESSITAIDASAATLGIDLNASATASVSITGSTKNDTLTGGSGSDSLFGGAGNDLFIVSGGTDTISDYTFTSVDSGEKDTIKSSSALKSTEASGDKDIKFTFADNSTLIVANAIGNSISTNFANVAETKVYGNIVASITKDGETVNYLTLDQAITAAATTDTITLKDNITLSETLTLNKNIIVALAGKTITADGVTAVNVTSGTFTVKDSGTGGKITSNVNASVGDQATIYVSGSGAKFVLESGTMENSGGAVGTQREQTEEFF